MAKTYFERTWKPVNMKSTDSGSSGGVSAYKQSVRWYANLISNTGKRSQKLWRYDQMDKTVDISRALDIMAEDISSTTADESEIFNFDYPEDEKIKKTTIKTLESFKKRWEFRTGFDRDFFDVCRDTLKYGCTMFLVNPDHTLTQLIHSRIIGYIVDEKDDTKITHYLYDEGATYINENGDTIQAVKKKDTNEARKIPVEDLLILKVGSGPYGTSVLDRVYRTWRQLQLVEDAIVIYRIVRAPERRVFYIDVGRLQGTKAEAYINKIRLKMRQKQVQRSDEVETQYNPQSMQEDYYIGQTGDGRGSKVDTLQGGQNLGEVEDLVYLNKKLALGLRIPHSYMSTYDNNAQPAQWSDGRVGTAYMEELRYASYIKRLQKKIAYELFKNLKTYAKKQEVEVPQTVTFYICEPQSFALYKENELASSLFNTYMNSNQMPELSKRWSLAKYLHLDGEELQENEYYKLLELGLTDEQIKSLTLPQRYSIVYGNGAEQLANQQQAGGEGEDTSSDF